jgi:hypothetical protein
MLRMVGCLGAALACDRGITELEAISLDCHRTLIDWDSGLAAVGLGSGNRFRAYADRRAGELTGCEQRAVGVR